MTATAPAPGPDPFGTAALRSAALTTWRTDPSRLRQDANLEEDHARGYYRDRVVVELAQNAADAASATADATLGGADSADDADARGRAAAGRATASGRAADQHHPGRLLLRLTTSGDAPELLAANTGVPLTAEGVAAMASLRASAKRRPGSVGRFGVGFAAVRSVSDEITVTTTARGGPAGVTFSLASAAALLADAAADQPALAAEFARRAGDLPALRLPFALADPPPVPPGYTTAVRLALRGPAEVAAVRTALDEVGDALLLALPALSAVVVEVDGTARTVTDVIDRWVAVHGAGELDPALLADRPVEERDRTGWAITWAVPRLGGAPAGETGTIELLLTEPPAASAPAPAERAPAPVVHAPTPTDEPCTLPALLVATLPLDPTRRHVAPGPLADAVVGHAGRLYAELAANTDPLALVPVGLPAGPLDAALHAAALAGLRDAPVLAAADGERVSPRAAQALTGPAGQDPEVLRALAPLVGGLVAVPADRLAAARVLGVALRDLADVVDALPTGGDPARWHQLYTALAPQADTQREALAGLPVPLADGRTVRGARGVLVPRPALADLLASLAGLGLRVAHPDAAHPLLLRLGAVDGGPVQVLDQPAVRAAVEAAAGADAGDAMAQVTGDATAPRGDADDAPDPAQSPDRARPDVVATVLDLVVAAVADGEDTLPTWLADLPLPAADGVPAPARDLVLPGSWAAGVLDALDPVAPEVVRRWGPAALAAVGVRADLITFTVPDVVAEPAGEEDVVEGWTAYLDHLAGVLGAGAYVGEVAVVADLDAVAADAWPRVLARLAEDPPARAALLTPVRSAGGGRPDRSALSYPAWWLREELGAPFAHPRRPTAVPFLPPAPAGTERLDDAVLAALGAVTTLADLDEDGWDAYLDHWPADGEIPLPAALTLWRGIAAAALAGLEPAPPESVPVLDCARARLLPAAEAVVGTPMWAQVRPVVLAPAGLVGAVADLLDVDAAPGEGDDDAEPAALTGTPGPGPAGFTGTLERGQARSAGTPLPEATDPHRRQTPDAARALLPGAPTEWWECTALTVDGAEVSWWVTDGEVWAATTAGLARGLAHAAGEWDARHAVEVALTDPDRLAELLAESAADTPPPGTAA